MKKLYFVFAALLSLTFCMSCSNEDSPEKAVTKLSVDNSNVESDYKVSKKVVTITGDQKFTTQVTMIDQKEELWCSASSIKKELSIRMKENFKKQPRKATIKITAPGQDPIIISVTQGAAAVERDPYWSDFGGVTWNDAWTYYTYLHNGNKFDLTNYEPAAGGSYKTYSIGTTTTLGVKLDQNFLREFNNKTINKLELRTNGPAEVTFAILKTKSVTPNTGAFPDYIKETVKTEELWRSATINHPIDTDWVTIDATAGVNFKLNSADGEYFIVAYIKKQSGNAKGEFVCVQQVLNKLMPTYVSFTGVTGQDLYHFIGGTCMINFYVN